MTKTIVWFRQDLRLADHRPLLAALAEARQVLPVFVLDDAAQGDWAPGAASRWWLHGSLLSLARDLSARGAALVLRRGDASKIIPALADEISAASVHAGVAHEPGWRLRDRALAATLAAAGRRLLLHRTATLHDCFALRTKTDTVYGVYTPFARAASALGEPEAPVAAPARIPGVAGVASDALESWELLPRRPDWAGGMRATWAPGEAGAAARLNGFLDGALEDYATGRNLPGRPGTSMLSPHLHWGEISAATVWHATRRLPPGRGADTYRAELLWREFSAYLLWHRKSLPDAPLRPEFAAMPWRDDPAGLAAWQRGRTGVPIVDAGMRQLWQTGWMHNRVRMIVASFLIKHLLISWQDGERWFWDTLVDADLASNASGWQWVAGTGIDASPFFRVFNPVTQGEKFDADGAYVRRYVPELAGLPDALIHQPWEAPAASRRGYPARPIIDLAEGRKRALELYEKTVRR